MENIYTMLKLRCRNVDKSVKLFSLYMNFINVHFTKHLFMYL